eukprot:1161562-Pelagomonas_calceolata.AAC.6
MHYSMHVVGLVERLGLNVKGRWDEEEEQQLVKLVREYLATKKSLEAADKRAQVRAAHVNMLLQTTLVGRTKGAFLLVTLMEAHANTFLRVHGCVRLQIDEEKEAEELAAQREGRGEQEGRYVGWVLKEGKQ